MALIFKESATQSHMLLEKDYVSTFRRPTKSISIPSIPHYWRKKLLLSRSPYYNRYIFGKYLFGKYIGNRRLL